MLHPVNIPPELQQLYQPTRYIQHGTTPSALDNIPNEIITEIFKHSIPPIPDSKRIVNAGIKHDNYVDLMTAPIKLSAVCKRWREAALKTPQIWTFFGYHLYTDQPQNQYYRPPDARMIMKWFERSGCLPLTIFLSAWCNDFICCAKMNYSNADLFIIRAIHSVSHRWKHVYYNLPNAMDEAVPRIPTVYLMLSRPNFSKTTTVHIQLWTIRDFIGLMKDAQGLESLTVSLVKRLPIDERDYSDEVRVVMPRLRDIDIDDFHGTRNVVDTEELLDRIVTPALKRLSIPIHDGRSGRFAAELVHRSRCTLEEIVFEQGVEEVDSIDMGNISGLLSTAPMVKVITVENWREYQQRWDRNGVSRWMLEFLGQVAFVPNLERVEHVYEYECTHCGPVSALYEVVAPLDKADVDERRVFMLKAGDSWDFMFAKHKGHPHELARDDMQEPRKYTKEKLTYSDFEDSDDSYRNF